MIKFRSLTAEDVECRVSQVGKDCEWVTLLLYKNARTDMRILDETVGPENWQREHYDCKGNLYCKIGINTNYAHPELPDRWVWKSDCGAESYTDKEKGEASDAFKRAGTNWGIGRELYESPFIFIYQKNKDGSENYRVKTKSDGKTVVDSKFLVTAMAVENGAVVGLNIESTKPRKTCFVCGKLDLGKGAMSTDDKIDSIALSVIRDAIGDGCIDGEGVLKYYGVQRMEDLTAKQAREVLKQISKKRGTG